MENDVGVATDAIGDQHRWSIATRQRIEPRRVARLDPQIDGTASEEVRRHRLHVAHHGPPRRRGVQRHAQSYIRTGGDRRRHAEHLADLARHGVGPAGMPPDQRHHRAAILGNRDDRRFGALVVQQRRQRPDQDAGRAKSDDTPPLAEPRLHGPDGLVEGVRGIDAAGTAPDFGIWQGRREPLRRRQRRGREDHDHRHRQACPRRCARIIEK